MRCDEKMASAKSRSRDSEMGDQGMAISLARTSNDPDPASMRSIRVLG